MAPWMSTFHISCSPKRHFRISYWRCFHFHTIIGHFAIFVFLVKIGKLTLFIFIWRMLPFFYFVFKLLFSFSYRKHVFSSYFIWKHRSDCNGRWLHQTHTCSLGSQIFTVGAWHRQVFRPRPYVATHRSEYWRISDMTVRYEGLDLSRAHWTPDQDPVWRDDVTNIIKPNCKYIIFAGQVHSANTFVMHET